MRCEQLDKVVGFYVPPNDFRVRAFLKRVDGMAVRVVSYVDGNGGEYASLGAYFGTVLFFPDDDGLDSSVDTELFGGINCDDALRADYAYEPDADRFFLLRAGKCGGSWLAFDDIPEKTVEWMETGIAAIMRKPWIDALVARDESYSDDRFLFNGEHKLFNGFVGLGVVGIPIRESIDSESGRQLAVGLSDKHDREALQKVAAAFGEWAWGYDCDWLNTYLAAFDLAERLGYTAFRKDGSDDVSA